MVYITIFTWKGHVLTGSVIRTYDVNIKGYSSVDSSGVTTRKSYFQMLMIFCIT